MKSVLTRVSYRAVTLTTARISGRIGTIAAVILVSACVSTSTRTAPVERKTIPVITSSPVPVNPARPAPVAKPPSKTVMPAVRNMMRQCRQSVSESRWQDAIANAERGLRIDRKEPYFYWTLAIAYQQLGNMTQAQSFANQGLRYVERGQPLESQLRDVLSAP